METEHFQAPFRVITLASIEIENNQIEKPSTKELTAWPAALKVACYQTTQIQTERFRESNWKHCKTAVLVERNLVAFWLATLGV